jgi:Holliday junction resolvase
MRTPNQRQADKHEEAIAQALGGVRTPGSGNQPGKGNDVVVAGRLSVECKSTRLSSISVKIDWLRRLMKFGIHSGRNVVLALRFVDVTNYDYVVIDLEYFQHLLRCETELGDRG